MCQWDITRKGQNGKENFYHFTCDGCSQEQELLIQHSVTLLLRWDQKKVIWSACNQKWKIERAREKERKMGEGGKKYVVYLEKIDDKPT